MFDSGISAKELIEELQLEVDVALDIPDKSYVMWLNVIEQLLYTEIIKEQKIAAIEPVEREEIDLSMLEVEGDEGTIRFEDVYAVYADNLQLQKSTVTSGRIFPDTFYKEANKLGYNTENTVRTLKICYYVKPKLKVYDETEGICTDNVRVPLEFIDLIKSKLRAEAYKVANENILAANWVNEYNALLEMFKAWITSREPQFGV